MTLAGVAAVPIWFRLPLLLPGLDLGPAEAAMMQDHLGMMSAQILGIAPILAAWLLVSLGTWTACRVRRRQCHFGVPRSWIFAAVVASTLVIAVLQGLQHADWLESLGLLTRAQIPAAIAAMCAAMAVPALIALGCERFGITAGIPTLLLGAALESVLTHWQAVAPLGLSWLGHLETAGLAAIVAIATLAFLGPRPRGRDDKATRTPSVCGLVPVLLADPLYLMSPTLAGTAAPEWLRSWGGLLAESLPARFAMGVAAALLFAWLHARNRREAGPEADPAETTRAMLASAAYTLLLLASLESIEHVGPGTLDLVLIVLGAATTLDIIEEWKARSRLGRMVAIDGPEDVPGADSLVRDLSGAGIAAYARGVHVRSLLGFLGPFIPVTVGVNPARAEEAQAMARACVDEAPGRCGSWRG